MNALVNNLMCTDLCPCPKEVESIWPGKVFVETGGIRNWDECIQKAGPEYEERQQKRLFTKGGDKFFKEVESQFTNCAAICSNVPDFYLSKDISEGKPASTCSDDFIRFFRGKNNKMKAVVYPINLTALTNLGFIIISFPFNKEWCIK